MLYVLLVLMILIIILLIINIILIKSSKVNNVDITERLGRFEINIMKELNNFKDGFSKNINTDFNTLNENVERRLMIINDKVNERLDQNFEKTNRTFASVIERLGKIDEAQKKIELLSNDIVSLESILTDKKSRGIFGEVNLNHILSSVFGERNDRIYKIQYKLSTGVIADSILFAPQPLGNIVIDSKFPLENYQMMVDKKIPIEKRQLCERLFKQDVKKHIDAISSKYIITGETADQAIMFLPAEAIFAEINAYHQDIIDYAYKRRVWITSPTTLISTLTVVEMIIKNIERDKYTKVIHEELNKLGIEFTRYKERWEKLSKSIQTVNKDIENFSITTDKLSKKFELINRVEVKELNNYTENKE
ncbi:MAG: DNA recombination protein RmuC [Bacilli bacterium]|nr:DNA recombination protein RmuC [Bacilli bacterium]